MALYGKLGNTLIAQKNLTQYDQIYQPPPGYQSSSTQQYQQQQQQQLPGQMRSVGNPNQMQYQQQQQPLSSKKINYMDFIRIKINNPIVMNLKDDKQTISYDIAQTFNSIKIPDITIVQKILESCDNAKKEYVNLVNLNIDEKKAETKSQDQIYSFSNGYESRSHLPHGGSFNKSLEDNVDKFMKKYNCSKQMAMNYIEAFGGNFDEACMEYERNNRAQENDLFLG